MYYSHIFQDRIELPQTFKYKLKFDQSLMVGKFNEFE